MIKSLLKKVIHSRKERIFKKYITQSSHNLKCVKQCKSLVKKYGFAVDEYYSYQLYKNNPDQFIPMVDSYIPIFANDKDMRIVSNNKIIFPHLFGKYFDVITNLAFIRNKKIIEINSSGLNAQTLLNFVKTQDLICKPNAGHDGQSIKSVHYHNGNYYLNSKIVSPEELLNDLISSDDYLIQCTLVNHDYIHSVFPYSLNTIRVVSAKTTNDCEHEILCAVHRIGTNKSKPADNFAQGGISATIDLETGIIGKATGELTIENGDRIFYSKHPDTGVQIESVKIPYWEEIKQSIIDFTKACPYFDFIAWDIAICNDNKFYVVETNMKSSLNVFQVHGGMKNHKLNTVIQTMKQKMSKKHNFD